MENKKSYYKSKRRIFEMDKNGNYFFYFASDKNKIKYCIVSIKYHKNSTYQDYIIDRFVTVKLFSDGNRIMLYEDFLKYFHRHPPTSPVYEARELIKKYEIYSQEENKKINNKFLKENKINELNKIILDIIDEKSIPVIM